MNFDWRVGLFVVSLVKDFVLVLGIMLIKFNDMKHMSLDLTEIKSSIKSMDRKVNRLDRKVAKIEGKIEFKDK